MLEQQDVGDVVVLRLRHGKANAMDVELLAEMERVLAELAEGESQALVLTASGRIFCAGVDLRRVLEGGTDYLKRFLPVLSAVLKQLFFFPKPLVTAANGHAIAGGCLLACAGDYRMMADGSGRIGVPELQVGVPFPALALEILRFVVPRQHLQNVVYSGKTYLPGEALEHGLIDALVAETELVDSAVAQARSLACIPQNAFKHSKHQLREPVWRFMQQNSSELDAEVLQLWSSEQNQQAIRSYVERVLK